MGIFLACMSVHMYAWYPRRPEWGIGSPGPWVTYGCHLPRGCWESNPGPLGKQPGPISPVPLYPGQFWTPYVVKDDLELLILPPSPLSSVITALCMTPVYSVQGGGVWTSGLPVYKGSTRPTELHPEPEAEMPPLKVRWDHECVS